MARRRPDRPLALRRTGIAAGHIGLHPTLIEKNQTSRINRLDRRLIGDPLGGHIRALLLTRPHPFLFAPQPPPFQRPTDAGQAHGPTRWRFKPRRVFGQGGVGLLLNQLPENGPVIVMQHRDKAVAVKLGCPLALPATLADPAIDRALRNPKTPAQGHIPAISSIIGW